jgi:hypothetical protein
MASSLSCPAIVLQAPHSGSLQETFSEPGSRHHNQNHRDDTNVISVWNVCYTPVEPMNPDEPTPWLLLIHQVPASPSYLRVKMWRRLQKIGAVVVKNAVYALPRSEQALEDFHWVAREILEGGGDASVCEATFIEGITNEELIKLFRAPRESDYRELMGEINATNDDLRAAQKDGEASTSGMAVRVSRLRQKLSEIQGIDFFSTPLSRQAETLVSEIEARIRKAPMRKKQGGVNDYSGRIWVTRKGIHVDRIASAWLIRRFIDSRAQFKFVAAKGYRPEAGEVRFDMFDAEFTHEGDLCTFEVLIDRMNLKDRALSPIAELIHDIDLKESKFARPETVGFGLMVNAICTAHKEDEDRLARGAAILDDLYEFYKKR